MFGPVVVMTVLVSISARRRNRVESSKLFHACSHVIAVRRCCEPGSYAFDVRTRVIRGVETKVNGTNYQDVLSVAVCDDKWLNSSRRNDRRLV